MKILIIGQGYIGRRCLEAWSDAVMSTRRICSVADMRQELMAHEPDVVLNAAGVTGKPNVDWCEEHQGETIQGNTILPLMIAGACQERGIYLLHLGTGCVFYGASPHPDGIWREEDYANPVAVYTKTKYAADLALSTLPNIGIARLRMPIDFIPHQANLIDKLVAYKRVVDVMNSVSVLDDLVRALRALLEQRASGIFHTVNPGAITHREIISLYEELVDPSHVNEWIAETQLVEMGLAQKKRSNNIMSSQRLERYGIRMRDVHEAMRDTMMKYAERRH